MLLVANALAFPPQRAANAQQAGIQFDIPAQALGDALYAYSSVTGIEILVPGDLVVQRRSADLMGVLESQEALMVLLSGTGLTARYTGLRSFTLLPTVPAAAPAGAWRPRYDRYSAALQAAVTNALCHFQATRPGDYRVAARIWVAPTGAVRHVSLLGTTGSAERDVALKSLLGGLVIDEPPSSDVPQPATLVILPRTAHASECRRAAAR